MIADDFRVIRMQFLEGGQYRAVVVDATYGSMVERIVIETGCSTTPVVLQLYLLPTMTIGIV